MGLLYLLAFIFSAVPSFSFSFDELSVPDRKYVLFGTAAISCVAIAFIPFNGISGIVYFYESIIICPFDLVGFVVDITIGIIPFYIPLCIEYMSIGVIP